LDDIHNAEPGRFAVQDGFFLRVCAKAVNNPEKDYVVLLDEFNRCNVPKVMGDLLTTMERSKRAKWDEKKSAWDLDPCQVVTLPASKRLFFVPENVYVVATMNSTDRSVAPLDSALRRRFAFHRCWPMGFRPEDEANKKVDCVLKASTNVDVAHPSRKVFGESVEAWVAINEALKEKGGPDALLGHSYLMDLADDLGKFSGGEKDDAARHVWVEHHWNHHILPQLADVLVTHTIESLLETKDAKPAAILGIKIGERSIVQPTETAREGRGQYGTLVLRLGPPKQAVAPKVPPLPTGENQSSSADGVVGLPEAGNSNLTK
jgi:5-methylcytosine-specific restriction endonuclease McrBC GTP-binding regulatory subunit McrB